MVEITHNILTLVKDCQVQIIRENLYDILINKISP